MYQGPHLRDVCVMGADPIAMLSDIHLADDGDVGKLFNFTAGVCAVSELVDVPLVAGSTPPSGRRHGVR